MSFEILYNPQDLDQLVKFYFVWIVGLFSFHCFLDHINPKTPKANISQLQNKISELYSVATVTTSLLLGSMILNGFKVHPLFTSDAMYLPLIMSAISGMLVGFAGLAVKIPHQTEGEAAD